MHRPHSKSSMATDHPTPSSSALPSSDNPLLSSPPQNHFSVSPSPSLAFSPQPHTRVGSRETPETDWVTDSSPSASPRFNQHSASSAARRQAGIGNSPSRGRREPYWPRRVSFARSRNLPRREGGGRSEDAGTNAWRHGTHEDDVEAQRSGGGYHWFEMLRLVMMGMCLVLLCMLGAFFGIWFAVLGKGKCVI
jgi:hypothetical protein